MTKKILFRVSTQILFLFVFACFAYGINIISEGYRLISGAASTKIEVQGTCKNVSCSGGRNIFVPTKSIIEWNAFLTNRPPYIQLDDCSTFTYCDNDADGHFSKVSALSCIGTSRNSQGDDCNDQCPECFPGSTSYTLTPDGLDQNCNDSIDDNTSGGTTNVRSNSTFTNQSCTQICSAKGESCVGAGSDVNGQNGCYTLRIWGYPGACYAYERCNWSYKPSEGCSFVPVSGGGECSGTPSMTINCQCTTVKYQ